MTKIVSTKERILHAAGDIFGKNGFKATTIREIAGIAKANVAAVNYHFRDKEGLYRAVLDDIFSKGFEKFPSVRPLEKSMEPDQRLQFFIHGMFYRFLSREGWGGSAGRGKLIAREFLDPTPAFEGMISTYINPQKEILVAILDDLSNGRTDRGDLLTCAFSIIGQCVYYAFAAPILQLIAKELTPTEENLDFLADHVYRFSLGGIQKINKEKHL